MMPGVVLIAASGVWIASLDSGSQTTLCFGQRIGGAGAAADRRQEVAAIGCTGGAALWMLIGSSADSEMDRIGLRSVALAERLAFQCLWSLLRLPALDFGNYFERLR